MVSILMNEPFRSVVCSQKRHLDIPFQHGFDSSQGLGGTKRSVSCLFVLSNCEGYMTSFMARQDTWKFFKDPVHDQLWQAGFFDRLFMEGRKKGMDYDSWSKDLRNFLSRKFLNLMDSIPRGDDPVVSQFLDQSGQVVELRKGDLFLFDSFLWHCAGPPRWHHFIYGDIASSVRNLYPNSWKEQEVSSGSRTRATKRARKK